MDCSRRRFLGLAAGAVLTGPYAVGQAEAGFAATLRRLEATSGGRLGVAVLDTGTGRRWGYREGERFAMCSTFKMMLVAAVLWQADSEKTGLEVRVGVPRKPLVGNSPWTEPHAGGTMTLGELCRAAVVMSDNTAANLLLERVHGPEGLTTFMHAMGDEESRLDRTEPTLNEARPGDVRDTTTPRAMLGNLGRVLLGDVLTAGSRQRLTGWMVETQTGLTCLRAGLPKGWTVGDKTGSDGVMTRNDIAIAWPGGDKAPLLMTAYLTECPGPDEKRNAVLAEVGRALGAAVSG